MGLFSKLFGGAGSDKADKMRQMAIDAFNAIQTPELKDLQVQLSKYVEEGRLTPEQAESQLLTSNAFNDIATDPALAGAQKQALAALQEVGTNGGMTAIDKARLADITSQQNQEARGRNEAVMSQARERGMGGSDITTVQQLLNEQAAADRASKQGTDVAAEAQARALQALIQAGTTATSMRSQDYGEQANKAQAENAIDLFNKQTLNQTNLYNVDAANRAQAANLANQQAISNANVNVGNTEKSANANARQQIFNDEMAKATGKAGTYNAWAGDATAANRSEKAADMALLGGAVQGVATAFGGPAGAAATAPAAGSMTANGGQPNTTMTYDELMKNKSSQGFSDGGEVKDENDERLLTTQEQDSAFNCGGYVRMNEGGKTPPLPIIGNPQGGWTLTDPNGAVIGDFPTYEEAASYAQKVQQQQPNTSDFRNGGKVNGQAKVTGDSPENDTVKAKLSPGEVVVPRTAMSDDEEFDAFMEKFRPSKREKQVDSDKPLMVQALHNLSSRVDRIEGR